MELHPSKKVMQHDFDRLYQSVYGFIFIMLGLSIDTSFVMVALQERAQGD